MRSRDALGRSQTWDVVWFTLWQALVSTGITVAVGLDPGVRRGPVRLRRTQPAARTADRDVRAADRRHGRRLPGAAARLRRPDRVGRDRRPRRVQPGRRGAGRRRTVGAPADRHGGRRSDARRVPVEGLHDDLVPADPTGDHGRRNDRLHLHVHVVRRHPDPRCTGNPNDRGRGVAARHATRRHRRGGRAGAPAADAAGGGRGVVHDGAASPEPGARPHDHSTEATGADPWRAVLRRARRRGRRAGRHRAAHRARRALVLDADRLVDRRVDAARSGRGPSGDPRRRRPPRGPRELAGDRGVGHRVRRRDRWDGEPGDHRRAASRAVDRRRARCSRSPRRR